MDFYTLFSPEPADRFRGWRPEGQPPTLGLPPTPDLRPTPLKADYRVNLAILRRHAAQADIPWWNFFNAQPFHPHYDPTEAQLRWQALTSVAFGASGVLYFCYWSPYKVFEQGGGIIVPRGAEGRYQRGVHYEHARRLNTAVLAFAQHLLHAPSTSVTFFNASGGFDAAQSVGPAQPGRCATVAALNSTGWPNATAQWLVGEFALADGRTAVLLHNQDDALSQLTTVTFASAGALAGGGVLEVSPAGEGAAAVQDDSPWMGGLQLLLQAGDARLLLLPAAA
jgi:hypothetical protein